jgi:T-complex protein 1 subunit alpha
MRLIDAIMNLQKGNELVKKKIHPTNVIQGFRTASKEACDVIRKKLAIPVSSLGRDVLLNVAKTSMGSKIIAAESDFFADLCVKVRFLLLLLLPFSFSFSFSVS